MKKSEYQLSQLQLEELERRIAEHKAGSVKIPFRQSIEEIRKIIRRK